MLACGIQHHRSASEKVPWYTVPLQHTPTGKTAGEEGGGEKPGSRLTASLIY